MHLVHAVAVKNLNAVVENNMIIFLRRIPANTKKQDIIDFINPLLKGNIFQKKGHIENIKILVLRGDETHAVEYHGLVTIDSDAVAKRIIKLNKKIIRGKHITVREYHHRLWQNDPRDNINKKNKKIVNTRQGNRRRSRLYKRADISIEFNGIESFQRKY